jgi:hypothetical protein
MAGAGFHSITKLRTQIFNPGLADCGVYSADSHNENGCTADCQSQESEFESELPKAWTSCRVRIRPESGGWQSKVKVSADCQAVILIVANRGIRAWSLAIEWNPVPAILHREACCLKHPIFLINDLCWHTISWHYTFKVSYELHTKIFIWVVI